MHREESKDQKSVIEMSGAHVNTLQLAAILAAIACGLCPLAAVRAQLPLSRVNSSQQYFAQATPSSASLIMNQQQQQHQQQSVAVTTQKPNYLETGRQITGILDRFMSAGYDKRVRPNYGGPPVEVNVTMRILSISSVSEVMMDFTADFYFRQTWQDPRLSFRKLGDIQTLYVGAEVSKKIWLPDTFFGNEKMAYFHEATTPNVFLRIDHSGEVYRSIRLTVTSSCPMNLQYFPMDRQRCTIEAESYGYNVKDIIYRWARTTAVERDKEISLPQFDIVQTVQKYRLEELSSGTYSRLIAEIHFARRMGYYLIQIYIPSSLIVVISWVSFWLHRNASPARVQLGVTTVLTMTTLMSSTNAALPKISYVKSIDIFLGTCFVMVFAALLEYATVGYLGKRIAMRKAHAQHAQSQAQAKLFAQLQAQGAQGDPLSEGAGSAGTPTVAAGNLGIFGHSPIDAQSAAACGTTSSSITRAQQQHQLLSGPGTPLSALFGDPQLLSAVAAAAAAAAAASNGNGGSSTSPDNHLLAARHQARSDQDHSSCLQVAGANTCNEERCSCDAHLHQSQTHNSRHHQCHAHQQTTGQCSHHRNAPPPPPPLPGKHCQLHHGVAPQAPPRRNIPLQKPLPCPCCDCTTGESNGKVTSHTLPRNTTFAHNCIRQPVLDYQSRKQLPACTCCAHQRHNNPHPHQQQQQQHHQQQPPSYVGDSMLPLPAELSNIASPGKVGVASAAAAAAATFVNLHRKNKGLPPSTNPNFAPFASSHMGAHDRHLETIFGIRPSDIDKYSRVVFPVCFVCFQLMYWIVYLHISAFLEPDQQSQQSPPVLPTTTTTPPPVIL